MNAVGETMSLSEPAILWKRYPSVEATSLSYRYFERDTQLTIVGHGSFDGTAYTYVIDGFGEAYFATTDYIALKTAKLG